MVLCEYWQLGSIASTSLVHAGHIRNDLLKFCF